MQQLQRFTAEESDASETHLIMRNALKHWQALIFPIFTWCHRALSLSHLSPFLSCVNSSERSPPADRSVSPRYSSTPQLPTPAAPSPPLLGTRPGGLQPRPTLAMLTLSARPSCPVENQKQKSNRWRRKDLSFSCRSRVRLHGNPGLPPGDGP